MNCSIICFTNIILHADKYLVYKKIMSNFLEIDFAIKTNDKKSEALKNDLEEVSCDVLLLVFIETTK